MDARQAELWSRLQTFEIDPPGVALPFAARLARECGWSGRFARQVVDEYRRFLLLAVTAGHPVTPSEEVDQAWHLHLAFSRSYWEELCPRVLGRALHHGPTQGGAEEDRKFRGWYAATLASYARVFGSPPPPAVWPAPERRFADATRFRRIDARAFVLLPRRGLVAGGAALLGLTGASCAVGDSGVRVLLVLATLGAIAFLWLVVRAVEASSSRARPERRAGGTGADAGGGCGPVGCGAERGSSSGDSGCGASGCGSGGCGGGGCGGD